MPWEKADRGKLKRATLALTWQRGIPRLQRRSGGGGRACKLLRTGEMQVEAMGPSNPGRKKHTAGLYRRGKGNCQKDTPRPETESENEPGNISKMSRSVAGSGGEAGKSGLKKKSHQERVSQGYWTGKGGQSEHPLRAHKKKKFHKVRSHSAS